MTKKFYKNLIGYIGLLRITQYIITIFLIVVIDYYFRLLFNIKFTNIFTIYISLIPSVIISYLLGKLINRLEVFIEKKDNIH